MKTLMIMVISSCQGRYLELMNTSMETWDSVTVDGVGSIFYCADEHKQSDHRVLYIKAKESFWVMSRKNAEAFEWALSCGFHFDYVMRVNSTCYVNKQTALDYVQTLPESGLFAGAMAPISIDGKPSFFLWGPTLYLSRDVVKLFVDNKAKLRHSMSEDVDMSELLSGVGVKMSSTGNFASLNKRDNGWLVISYGNPFYPGGNISDIGELHGKKIPSLRVKQYGNESIEPSLIRECFLKNV